MMRIFQTILVLGWTLLHTEGAPVRKEAPRTALRPEPADAAPRSRLRATPSKNARGSAVALNNNASMRALGSKSKGSGSPCSCDLGNPTWVPCSRGVPRCIFIDLGAADGNTFQAFVHNEYGPVQNCPSAQWQATLVEANPRFNGPLKQLEGTYPGSVHAAVATAAYMCEAQTTFYLDTQNHDENYWGSSMSANHVDTQASGHQAVTVPTLNILKLLYESSTPSDYVILKMDIEGAEWDVLPCLANSPVAHLVDRLLVEIHPQAWGNIGTTQQGMDQALATLRQKGVDIPAYHSHTL